MAHNKNAIIQAALMALDVTNNDLWTSDGSPRIDALGIPGLKRAEIVAAAPQFSRENPTVDLKTETREGSFLLGSSVQPDIFYLKDETTKQLGEIVQAACTTSELSVDEWNELSEKEREVFIQAEVDKLDVLYEDEIETETEPKVETLADLKKKAEAKVAEATKAKVAAEKIEKEAIRELDEIINSIEQKQGGKSTQMDIMDYIASQQKIRAARAARHNQFVAQGVDFSKIGPAPIDQAMGRKNTRGTKRPVRALIGNSNG